MARPGGDEAERGALPGQERALVGERQLDVGLVAVGGLFGRDHGRSSWPTAPPVVASTARGSVTPVTEIVVNGTGAAAVTGAVAVVAEGVERGLHLGAQLYASVDGKVVADLGIGHARAGVPMTPDSMVVWFSMTKPSVAVAVAQQWERGALELDDRVAEHLPEFATHGKDEITIRHLLTHTAGIRAGDAVTSTAPGTAVLGRGRRRHLRDRARARLGPGCAGRLPPQLRDDPARRDRAPMRRAPLRAVRARRGLRAARHGRLLGGHAAPTGSRRTATASAPCTTPRRARRVPLDHFDSPDFLRLCIPGGGGRGPVRQLARLYEALLGRGALEGHRVLTPQTVEAITARHRVGLYDETFHAQCDWGLGFAVDAFAMGRHASPRAFGHGGALSAISFADPEHGLVAVVQTNGMCGNDDHYLRLDAVTTAPVRRSRAGAPRARPAATSRSRRSS